MQSSWEFISTNVDFDKPMYVILRAETGRASARFPLKKENHWFED